MSVGSLKAGLLLVLCGGVACSLLNRPRFAHHPLPKPDGINVILYDVHVVEDDSDCGARVPIKESDETMVVDWYNDRDVTMFARGGFYQTDLTLDERGEYSYDGTGGVCLPGSEAWGRLNRQEGDAHLRCIKATCRVSIDSHAVKHVETSIPDAGLDPGDAAVP